MKSVNQEEAISQALKSNIKESGLYFIPAIKKESENKKFKEKMKNSPYAKMIVYPNGKDCSLTRMLILTFLMGCFLSGIMTCLLSYTSGLSLLKKTKFVAVAGFVGSASFIFSNWNWWGYTCVYVLVICADTLIAWSLVGLGLGKFVAKD